MRTEIAGSHADVPVPMDMHPLIYEIRGRQANSGHGGRIGTVFANSSLGGFAMSMTEIVKVFGGR